MKPNVPICLLLQTTMMQSWGRGPRHIANKIAYKLMSNKNEKVKLFLTKMSLMKILVDL